MFGLTETQEIFQREIRAFARKELAPLADKRAKLDHMPADIMQKLADMGLFGMCLPEKYGGVESDWVSMGIAIEELARVDTASALMLIPAKITGIALQFGTEQARADWLPGIIQGKKIPTLAITEPDCGSDAAAMRTRAIKKGDKYIISGEKTSITNGMQGDVSLVFAKTDPTAGARGVSCLLVPLDLPGVSRSLFEDMGWRQANRASLFFDEVAVPTSYLVGEENRGFQLAMQQFDFARIGLSLTGLGMAQESLENAITYASQRTAFGRPLAEFEAIAFKIAEDATLLEAGRLLCYRALSMRDQGLTHTKETAMCKWWVPKISLDAIHNALLIHGHLGYSDEYPVERRMRDAVGLEIADGPAEVMKLVIARELIGRQFAPR
ncbi:MAG: acyl-CoA dehydrogenase family protein [Dehalococcoidia bacterium]|nr:acyl-CoA dehydrogenase family protein [Dehalococcoidia bacterium]